MSDKPDTRLALVQTKEEHYGKLLSGAQRNIVSLLPQEMRGESDVQRFLRGAVEQIARSPDLWKCSDASIRNAVMELAQIGLTLGSVKHAHLLNFGGEAKVVLDYRGLAALAALSPGKPRTRGFEVRKGDVFRVVKGTENPRIEHEQLNFDDKDADIIFAYAVSTYDDGAVTFTVVPRGYIDRCKRDTPMWKNWFPAACRKTAVKQHLNQSHDLHVRARIAIDIDNASEGVIDEVMPDGKRHRAPRAQGKIINAETENPEAAMAAAAADNPPEPPNDDGIPPLD